jgi:hypothetical protein
VSSRESFFTKRILFIGVSSASYITDPFRHTKECEMNPVMLSERIEERIYFVRKRRVMLSMDLAALYGLSPRS